MRKDKYIIFIILIVIQIFVIPGINALSDDADTIRTYRLGEVVKTSGRDQQIITPSVIHEVNYREIQRSDAASVAGLKSYIPSALVQTNSRGEALLYLRGAAERQLALFFDGALINVPWDNRMDLSFVPTDIIGRIKISQGAASVLYGANVLGGAVNIATYERTNDGYGLNFEADWADGFSQHYSMTHDGKKGIFNYILNFTYLNSPGIVTPFIEPVFWPDDGSMYVARDFFDGGLIKNSDQERFTAYARGEFLFEKSTFGLSVNHIGGEKGVIPETHLKIEDARFWRYPDVDRWLFTLNGEHLFSNDLNMSINGTLWYDLFEQKISSYESLLYNSIDEMQKDYDNTFGSRISFSLDPAEGHNLTMALNLSHSRHMEELYNSTNNLTSASEFEQILYSLGAEYKLYFKELVLTTGGSFDGINTPLTGNFTEAEGNSITDFGALFGGRYFINSNLSLFGNISRKTRFPTLREQFSAALGKFIVNPDLKAESGILSEAGINYKSDDFVITFALFTNFYDDLISRTNVIDPIDSNLKQMRINIDQARIGGAEASFYYELFNGFDFRGNLTFMYAEGKDGDIWGRKLEYKPNIIAFIMSRYSIDKFDFQIEADLLGTQFAENPYFDGFLEIEPTAKFNFRTSYRSIIKTLAVFELFLRVDNILNVYREPKLGLPEAGRTLSGGIKLII